MTVLQSQSTWAGEQHLNSHSFTLLCEEPQVHEVTSSL